MKTSANVQPLVSVLVPSYQAGPYLGLLIESVLAQTYENWELLILDDGSGDLDHPEVAGRLQDPRIRTFRWQPNRGVSQATRFVMQEAKGEFWCYPGADDLLRPLFIEKRLSVLADHPEVSLVFGKGGQIDAEGGEIWFQLGREMYQRLQSLEDRVIGAEDMLSALLAGNIINTPSILARSRATLPVLLRHSMDWRYCQDWFYWLLLAAHGLNFYYASELLHDYRFHEQAMTQSKATWAWRNVEPALVLLCGLALAAQTSDLAMRWFARHRHELFGNWLVRSARFRRHPEWDTWQARTRCAPVRGWEWPLVAGKALQVHLRRRSARRQGKVLHGLPSVYLSHPIFR
jgi:glycosyltransferase involved in cell wall biosynthesis